MPIPGGPRPVSPPPRTLTEAAAHLRHPLSGASVRVSGVTLSSRTVRPGDLYAALPGARVHGARFAAQAADAGAVAVLTDPAGREILSAAGVLLPCVVVPEPRAVLGGLAAWLYGDPGKSLSTYGVTGTNGKTTTTFLIDSALRALGRTTGLIGTIEIRVAGERVTSTGTTPEAPDLHALLAVMVERGVEACSMEISSHALVQHRTDGLVVDVAGFTNLSQDHLDYHGTLKEYFAAKALLFTPAHAARGVVCVDDDWGLRLLDRAEIPVVSVRTRPRRPGEPPADWQVTAVRPRGDGRTAVVVDSPAGSLALTSPLPGDFNVANTLVAVAMLVESGIDAEQAGLALAAASVVPGRMEPVAGTGTAGEPLVIVDYAHTPDAVAAALRALAGQGHPLVVVLGAGGDRDADKRPLMGAAAAEAADVVLVTDDNPRSEDPAAIRAAVVEGAQRAAKDSGAEVLEIPERRDAIIEGVHQAWGGVLLLAGKGHEQGQEIAGHVSSFDDRVVAREVLETVARAHDETSFENHPRQSEKESLS